MEALPFSTYDCQVSLAFSIHPTERNGHIIELMGSFIDKVPSTRTLLHLTLQEEEMYFSSGPRRTRKCV